MIFSEWDALIDTWSTGERLPDHIGFEILNAVHVGHRPGDAPPLKPDAPVPGCDCSPCTGVRRQQEAKKHRLDSLPVESARAIPILETVERLGLGPTRRVGKEHVCRCFMHDDARPSLSLNATTGLWYCPVCATGGDGIEMVRRVRGLSFADAVKEMVP